MNNRNLPRRTASMVESLEDRRHLSLTVKLDYTYDTSGFFATQARRDVLAAAVKAVAGTIKDNFAAITPSGANAWDVSFDNPSGSDRVYLHNPTIAADTMVLYVGAENLNSGTLANASPAAAALTTAGGDASADWSTTVNTRGRPTLADGSLATPTVGRIAFNPNFDWYAGLSAPSNGSSQYDLYSVAQHEFGHILGVGASAAWDGQIANHLFYGPASRALYGGAVPTQTDPLASQNQHPKQGVEFDGQEILLAPGIGAGTRRPFGRLDLALVKDLGYDISIPAASSKYGSLTGYAFDDANNSRTKDAGEGGFGAIMYLDANANGVLDSGEISVPTDADGKFTFTSVPIGWYRLGQYDPSGQYTLKGPAGVYQNVRIDPNTKVGPILLFSQKSVTSTGGISGQIFSDDNGNGVKEASESLYTGSAIKAYLDLNGNSVLDANEPSAGVDWGGIYTFNGLTPGTYTVRLAGLTEVSSVQSLPDTGGRTVTAVAGQTLAAGLFGVQVAYAVGGYVYNDANGNRQVDPGETGLAGRQIYADYNANAKRDANEPVTTTDANGYYVLRLPAGSYQLDQIRSEDSSNSGRTTNDPYGSDFELYGRVKVSAATPAYVYNFLSQPSGTVTVYAYDDTNANGYRDSNEPLSSSSHLVYVDKNTNGVLDAGEPTGSTVGGFTFTLPSGGAYVLRIVPKGDGVAVRGDETVVITPGSSQTIYFGVATAGASIRGTVYNDKNLDGDRDRFEDGLYARMVYLDFNNNGQFDGNDKAVQTNVDGSYVFAGLAGGTYNVRAYVPAGYVATGVSGATARVTVGTDQNVSGPDFGLADNRIGTVSGTVFSDANNNGKYDAGDTPTPSVGVFVDFNFNDRRDDNEPYTTTDAAGGWSFTVPAAGNGVHIVLDYTGDLTTPRLIDLLPVNGQNLGGNAFGLRTTPPAGTVLEGESATFAGGTAKGTGNAGYTGAGFADFGGQNSSAQWTLSRTAAGAATLTFRYANGTTANRPLTVYVNGVAVGTLAFAPTGSWSTWKTVSIDAGLVAGTNTIKAVASSSTGGGNVDSLTITSTPVTPPPAGKASITGSAFNDNNANGKYDTGDGASKSVRVFLDLDNDGLLDADETSVLTDSNGKFTFAGLVAGTYRVRRVFSTGYISSTPAADITVTATQAKTGVLLGSKKA